MPTWLPRGRSPLKPGALLPKYVTKQKVLNGPKTCIFQIWDVVFKWLFGVALHSVNKDCSCWQRPAKIQDFSRNLQSGNPKFLDS